MTSRTLRLFSLALAVAAPPALAQRMTDEEIRRFLMDDSIRMAGECPCPYSYGWNGRQCADKSQYSQSTGTLRPLCYPHDVSHAMIREYREKFLR